MTHIKIDSSFVFIHLQMFILFEHFHFNTSEFVFAFFGQQAEVHRTIKVRYNGNTVCGSQRDKDKIVALKARRMPHIRQKSRAR